MTRTSFRNALIYGAIYAQFPLVAWLIFISPWRAAHRSLDNLARTSGVIDTVSIQRSSTKDHSLYLEIILQHNPQWFGIKEYNSHPVLDSLQRQLRPGQPVTVYYDPDWKIPGLIAYSEFDVYQLESAGRLVYSLEETHQRYFEDARTGGITILCVIGFSVIRYYLSRRANS